MTIKEFREKIEQIDNDIKNAYEKYEQEKTKNIIKVIHSYIDIKEKIIKDFAFEKWDDMKNEVGDNYLTLVSNEIDYISIYGKNQQELNVQLEVTENSVIWTIYPRCI